MSYIASAHGGEIAALAPEFIVTSNTSYDQHDVWVDCTDEGNFVVSYALGEIFMRRLDRDGHPLGDDTQVNLTLTYGTQDETYVECDPSTGDFLVCYSDRHGNDGFEMGAAGRFYGADGAPRGAEKILNVNTDQSQFEPHAAFMVNGRVLVVWGDSGTDGSVGCVGRIFDRSGNALTAEFLINEPSTATQIDPSVSCSRDGLFVVAFVDASGATGEPREVLVRLFDQDGVALGTQRLVNSPSVGMQRDPIVAMDADGDFVVVWQDESGTDGDGFGVFARLFDENGDAKGAQFVVCEVTDGNQRDPHVTMDYAGNFVVTWESDAGGDWDVCLRRFDRFGQALSGDLEAHSNTAGDQTQGKSCLTQSGERLITVWHDESGDGDAYARVFSMPALQASGDPALTQTVSLHLDAPGMGGSLYFILPSLGTAPPINVNGARTLDLAVDDMLLFAVTYPESPVFSHIAGTLDPSGQADATFTVPNLAEFYDLPVHFAGLTLDPGWGGTWNLGSGAIDGVEFLSEVVTVLVDGPRRFHPGQELVGEIVAATDEDHGLFEATKGETLKIKIAAVDAGLQPNALSRVRLEILDDEDALLRGWTKTVPALGADPLKLKYKIEKSGTYVLRILGPNGGLGHFRLLTSHRVTRAAQPREKTLEIGKSLSAKIGLQAVADTLLCVDVKPLGGAPFPTDFDITGPGGSAIDVAPYLWNDGVRLHATDVPLSATGKHQVILTGPKGADYKVTVTPTPPAATGPLTLE
ncbi:MAG: hypothetical protein HY812_04405 [Planctomycetes bacterium]|nr:hypothetical protein [Planctomycetota bacterium]